MRIIVSKTNPTSRQNTSGTTADEFIVHDNTERRNTREVPDPDSEITTIGVYNSSSPIPNPSKQEEGDGSSLSKPRKTKKTKKKILYSFGTSTYSNATNSPSDEGYNSSDEVSIPKTSLVPQANLTIQEEFQHLAEKLRLKYSFRIKKMAEDGNCLFRSIADQIYGDPEMHDQIRVRTMDYMVAERDHFSQFVTEDFDEYVQRKRCDKCYGNNLEIQAMGELFNRPIEIYTIHRDEPINIFHGQYSTDNAPIRVSYHQGNHYNSVIDPNNPTVGVGLGLPSFEPGLADKMQIRQAFQESENSEVDKLMLEEFRQVSELEQAEKAIEEAILLESRRAYFEDMYKKYNL